MDLAQQSSVVLVLAECTVVDVVPLANSMEDDLGRAMVTDSHKMAGAAEGHSTTQPAVPSSEDLSSGQHEREMADWQLSAEVRVRSGDMLLAVVLQTKAQSLVIKHHR